MAFTLKDFGRCRPYLFHLTHEMNVPRIRKTRELLSAAELMRRAGDLTLLKEKRAEGVFVQVDDVSVHIRDQAPLYENNMFLDDGLTFADWIGTLNGLVFFWPGKLEGPIIYGKNHYKRYRSSSPRVLRIEFQSIVAVNYSQPLFCKYNSGSPRCSNGQRSSRGKDTFVAAAAATFSPSDAVEVTFSNRVKLPDDVRVSESTTGPWRQL